MGSNANASETTPLLSAPDHGVQNSNRFPTRIVSFHTLTIKRFLGNQFPFRSARKREAAKLEQIVSLAMCRCYIPIWAYESCYGFCRRAGSVRNSGRPVYNERKDGLLQIGHGLFLIANFLSVFAQTEWQLLLLRFIAGGAGSGPLSIGAGVIGDLWEPEQRGLSIALYTLGPLLGPAIGPIGAAHISANSSWRWIFGVSSIYILATFLLGLCTLRETYLPVITQRKRVATQSNTRPSGPTSENHTAPARTAPDSELKRDLKSIKRGLLRPFSLLWSEPLIQVLAIFTGYLFGLNHLTITTFQSLWKDTYQQDTLRASWNYGFIAIGFVLGSQITGFTNDRIYKPTNKEDGNPEIRVYMMLPASLLVPAGLLLYGWSAERRMHWLIPDIGVTIYAMGLIMSYQCAQAYIIDCYTSNAASSMSALMAVRSVAGFVFPIIAPILFASWGYGLGSTWLAGFAALMGMGLTMLRISRL
ncbi:hypothetical protein NUW58_g5459 [Xylaria curta]|uniref:Uncharacterized protein n=1 Tax=Xylaria curta TaxID=42375 RepID=A0ACC1P2M1_9PEZI|nr:hypothetical protein NUW58_g5459 [Xylaria curta]